MTHTAAHRGVLAFGPDRGRKVTYTSPGVTPMESAAALPELVRRYLHAYGPATPLHFAKWLATSRNWAAELFATLAGQGTIEEVAFEGGPARVAAGGPAGAARREVLEGRAELSVGTVTVGPHA